VSFGIGAYWDCSSIVTSDEPVRLSASTVLTLPTVTPEMRTSASCASWAASRNGTVTR
jgi:hypothetical protein